MLKTWKKRLLSVVLSVAVANVLPMPVTVQAEETTKGTVIDVTDYGADPSGKYDSTEAVMKALEDAKEIEGEKTLNFPYGEYRFDKDHATTRVYHTSNTSSRNYPEKKISILLEDVDDLTIEGNDSTLLVYGDIMALAVVESDNVTIQNLVMDYKDADTIDVSVVETGTDSATGKQYADIFIPEAYNYKISEDKKHIQWQGDISAETGRPYWTWEDANFCAYLVVYKGYDRTVIRANNKEASNPFTGVTSIEPSGESTVRFTYEERLPEDIVEGNIYQLSNSAWRQTAGAFFWESEDLTVSNIDVHYLSGFGWLTQMCKNVEFTGVDFLPRDGSGKYTTSNADQLHVAGCGGYFKVTNCNFSMAHDDPINVHGTYMRVEEVIDNKTLKVKYIHGQQGGFRQFHAGDEVLFYSRTYLEQPDGQTEENPYIVASSIGPSEEYQGAKLDLVTEIVTFEEPLPDSVLADLRTKITRGGTQEPLFVAENVTYTPEVTIKDNLMKSIPTRGILCTTRKPVMIEGNTFDNMAMANIYLSNDADYWYESGPIRNLTIKDNTFYIRPTGIGGVVSGIYVEPVTVNNATDAVQKDTETLVHENIRIIGNTFHISNDNVVTANRVDGLEIKDNIIIHDDTLSLSLEEFGSIGVGESRSINGTVKENVLNKNIFEFNDCRNVVVENNTYDEGMNLNIRTTKMNSGHTDHLKLGEHDKSVLTVNQSSNKVTSAQKIQYVSSDPTVAYIADGKITGVKAGTAKVQAYIEKNGALFLSNEITVTVGEGAAALEISAEKNFFENKNEEATLTVPEGTEVTWQVLDPLTGRSSEKGVVKNGKYIAKEDGAVVVKATAASGSTAQMLMVNSFPESYHEGSQKTDKIEIVSPTDGDTVAVWEDAVKIHAQPNGNGIYNNSASVNNIVKIDIEDEMENDLILQVTATGLLEKGAGYSSSGIMLYEDLDNYLFVGKRNHMDGVSTMHEQGGSNCQETAGSSTANGLTETTFEIHVSGETATISYLDGNGEWQKTGEYNIGHLQAGELKLGLISWKNGEADFAPVYSKVRMAKASETGREEMKDVEPVKMFTGVANDRPVVRAVSIEGTALKTGQEVTVAVTSEDMETYLYQWTIEGAGGKEVFYTKERKFTPSSEGTLKVAVVVFDWCGKPSKLFVSPDSKTITTETDSDDELKKLYINGNEVKGLKAGGETEFYLPAGISQIRFSYDKADSNVATAISGGATATIAEGETSAVVEAADSYTLTRGSAVYTIKVNRVGSSDNSLKLLKVGDHTVDLEDEIKDGTNSYFVQLEKDTDTVPLNIETTEAGSKIRVTRSYFEHPVASAENGKVTEAITMTAGINAYYIYITAPDGVSEREVKLYLYADGYTDAALDAIRINGEDLEGFAPDQEEYILHVSAEEAESLTISVDAKDGQDTSITYQGDREDGTEATVSLTENLNRVVIANMAKNIWSRNFYVLNIVVDSQDNADLFRLSTEPGLGTDFDPETEEYTLALNTTGELQVSAEAQMPDAQVAIRLEGDSTQDTSAKGSASGSFALKEGDNKILVEVTAADGTTKKTYTLNAPAKGLVYASDVIAEEGKEGITYTKKDVGYGSLVLDGNVGGSGKIALPNENGERVVFDKGLGAHASSDIIFQLEEGHAFTSFEAYAGVDYVQYNTDQSSVSFQVWVDNEKKWDSDTELGAEVRATTPMMFVQIDIRGASEVRLVIDDKGYNGYDHSEWADACFIRSLGGNTDEPVDPNPPVDPDQPVDNAALLALITKAEKEAELRKYTDASVKKLKEEIQKAKTAADSEAATSESLAQAAASLQAALGSLEVKKDKAWIFTDVKVIAGEWKYESVKYVYNYDIMGAVGGSKEFQPDEPLNRAMFATVLYRMAGEPAVTFKNQFPDVPKGQWYSDAVIWAFDNGIVSGIEGGKRYGTTELITREQIAKMLYEYANKVCKYDVTEKKDLAEFTDVKKVSAWATDYMKWATAVGMITGKPNDAAKTSYRLAPQENATRAECAAMLMRFENKYLGK